MVDYSEFPGIRIPQFFAGRAVLITGATGFMGKVLVQRLLTTCPDVAKLYLLVRDKAGAKPEERLAVLKQLQVFDSIRDQDPAQLDKLRIVTGDITLPGLGISDKTLAELEEVSVVFHNAAALGYTEPLRRAAESNVLSVMQLMDLCDRLPRIQAFVHVSTAYCHSEHSSVEERVYPLPRALPNMLASALAVPDDTPNDEVKRLIYPKENTYIHTKTLAEAAVAERKDRRYPIAIFRPTVVIGAFKHPCPGWIDNFNGPNGVLAAVRSGIFHVFHSDGSKRADLLPVDMAIDTLIAVAWETAIDNLPAVRVYNCSTSENPTTWGAMLAATLEDSRQYPLSDIAWYPTCYFSKNKYIYLIVKVFVQTIPFYFIGYMMKMLKHQKNRINPIKMHSRLSRMNDLLAFFVTHEWDFSTGNVRRLRRRLCPADAAIFNLDPMAIDWKEQQMVLARGCRVYLSQYKEETLSEARRRLRRLYLIHITVTILLPMIIIYLILQPGILESFVQNCLYFTNAIVSSICMVFGIQ